MIVLVLVFCIYTVFVSWVYTVFVFTLSLCLEFTLCLYLLCVCVLSLQCVCIYSVFVSWVYTVFVFTLCLCLEFTLCLCLEFTLPLAIHKHKLAIIATLCRTWFLPFVCLSNLCPQRTTPLIGKRPCAEPSLACRAWEGPDQAVASEPPCLGPSSLPMLATRWGKGLQWFEVRSNPLYQICVCSNSLQQPLFCWLCKGAPCVCACAYV